MELWINFSILAGPRTYLRVFKDHCLGTQIWWEYILNYLEGGVTSFAPQMDKSHRLCSLLKCHCKQGHWMGYTDSHVLSLDYLVGRTNGYIQQCMGLGISFHICTKWDNIFMAEKVLCGFTSSQPMFQVSWPNKATLLYRLSAVLAGLPAWVSLGCSAFHMFWLAL